MKTTAQIREDFLNFFESKGHRKVASSSLVPENDPTLLFANAGMNQFKEVFLGQEVRDYTRATTSQRCVRAGGKHNDLDNVGYTARHHTFFEMLGNFSFGDYFKEDAISFAWEFLTSEKWLNLPKDRLYVTVYKTDDEAFDIWHKKIGLTEDRIIRIGDKYEDQPFNSDNFWQMGDTGPCGPCTEIFYDHGEHIWGGLPGTPDEDGDRFIEIWNIVFMQFNRKANGEMLPLPKPSVDTGMGLERIAAVLQHVNSNYETDIFDTLIKEVANELKVEDLSNKSLRVVADHIRSCAYLIADGVTPSNEGRGYVLRRIIRRAVRHGNFLGATDSFFYKLVPTLAKVMGSAGDLLTAKMDKIQHALKVEEEQFARTLERGLKILEDALADIKPNEKGEKVLSGEVAFKLYDTYGFPVDLTADVCRDRDISVDEEGFEKAMKEQISKSQAGSNFKAKAHFTTQEVTDFYGYHEYNGQAEIREIFVLSPEGDYQKVESIDKGEAVIVLNRTPFYGEMGGQIGDTGTIKTASGEFIVEDTQKQGKTYLHYGKLVQGVVSVGETADLQIEVERRLSIGRNHLATHILHAALHKVLGPQALQKGSLVSDDRLRFDFAHDKALTQEEIDAVEHTANAFILANYFVKTERMPLAEARAKGALALFDEKYEDIVRVVTIEGCGSMELCGGTHSEHTGDVGLLRITNESGIAAGIRRIEAVTGWGLLERLQSRDATITQTAQLLKSDSNSVMEKIKALVEKARSTEKELAALKEQLAAQAGANLASQATACGDAKVLVSHLTDVDAKTLRSMIDDLKNQLGSSVVVLVTNTDDKVSLAVGVSKDLTSKVNAGQLVGKLAGVVGGKGGGRPDFAMAGGSDKTQIENALALAKEEITTLLK